MMKLLFIQASSNLEAYLLFQYYSHFAVYFNGSGFEINIGINTKIDGYNKLLLGVLAFMLPVFSNMPSVYCKGYYKTTSLILNKEV